MRNPGGYAAWSDDGGKVTKELDTFTCIHCNTVVLIPHKASPAEMGGWCMMCSKPVCKHCAGGDCIPFEKKLDLMEARDRLLRHI